MKVRDIMSNQVIRIGKQEPAEVAARTLTHYNVGILPVCGSDGRVCGVVTDRDLVTRCMAPGFGAGERKVRDVMTGRVISVSPDMDVAEAAAIMGREQIRRLPVVENEKLCGMVSLADLTAMADGGQKAADTLEKIISNVRKNN